MGFVLIKIHKNGFNANSFFSNKNYGIFSQDFS